MAKHNRVPETPISAAGSDMQDILVFQFIEEPVQRCCGSLKSFLRGLCVECTIITLTVIDLFLITIELLIRANVIQDPSSSASSSVTVTQTSNKTAQNDIDPGGGCTRCGLDTPVGTIHCLSHYFSFIIAVIFFVELMFRLGTSCSKMCKDIIQLIDAFTVFNLAAIEVVFTVFWEKTLCANIGLEAITYIVALRLLRIPRACNVLKEEYSEKMDLEVHYLSRAKSRAEERSKELANTVEKQQQEIETLRRQLGSTSLYENSGVIVHHSSEDQESSNISNGRIHRNHNEQSPKYVSTIKTDSNIVTMTAPASENEKRESELSYAAIGSRSEKLQRKGSSENKAIYKNVCHVKSPAEIKRTSSELGSRISFECDPDNKNLIHRSKSTKSIKGDAIKKAIAMLEQVNPPADKPSGGGLSVSRTPSNKLNELDNTKLQDTDSGCVNGSFESDEEVVKRNLPVMAEYQGTRTYRSAEGVPLTDL